jgi:hypothetical protein
LLPHEPPKFAWNFVLLSTAFTEPVYELPLVVPPLSGVAVAVGAGVEVDVLLEEPIRIAAEFAASEEIAGPPNVTLPPSKIPAPLMTMLCG